MSNIKSDSPSDKMRKKIRIMRQEAGLSQKDLARRLDISKQAVNKIERGENRFTIERLFRVFDALDYDTHISFERRGNDAGAGISLIQAKDRAGSELIGSARKLSKQAAAYLYKKFNVEKVYVFGSLVEDGGKMFTEESDIDFLVKGLAPENLFSAQAALEIDVFEPFYEKQHSNISFNFDLIRIEDFEEAEQIISDPSRALLLPDKTEEN
ncbi:MAG: helix-turn-helix domain-containing protein [bacterium]